MLIIFDLKLSFGTFQFIIVSYMTRRLVLKALNLAHFQS